jgi:hypothetical protein
MSTYRPNIPNFGATAYPQDPGYVARATPRPAGKGNFRMLMYTGGIILLTNVFTHSVWNPKLALGSMAQPLRAEAAAERLYLLDKARQFVGDTESFESKVREIAAMLQVPAEWLMAVMHSESKFDASALNLKGSGATGLIQFMPATATDLNVSTERLRRMGHLQQLEYVYLYLQQVRERYGEFNSLTDLYLGILYPRGINQDYCFTLYAKPSVQYEQNAGLDENKDGRVTVSDIDKRMQRLYGTAYQAQK